MILFPHPESPLDGARRGAIFGNGNNPTSPYRYVLWRTPDPSNPRTMAVIGCNPSTATATEDDPTIRRCIRFALDSGHGRLVMLNLFAYRATDVRDLAAAAVHPMGENQGSANMRHIAREVRAADTVVCAWGARSKFPPGYREHGESWAGMMGEEHPDTTLHVFRLTQGGDPFHPLYLPASCRPVEWAP